MLQTAFWSASLGFFALATFVQAQCDPDTQNCVIPPKLRVTNDATCQGGKLLNTDPVGWVICENYTSDEDMPEFPKTDQGEAIAYISGDDVYTPQCKLLIYRRDDGPTCGQLIATVTPDTPCRQFTFPANFALGWCCTFADGDTCAINQPGGFAEDNVTILEPGYVRSHPRDLLAAGPKAAEPLKAKRDECKWNRESGPTDVDDVAQRLSSTLQCPSTGDSCAIQDSYSVTTEQTNTFGVSAEFGASFFELVQVSTSFSYEYSFSESQSTEQSYTVTLAAGQRGYLTWTPKQECTWGHWTGDCDWDTKNGDTGRACVPKYLGGNSGGQLDGTYNLVEEL